MPSRASWDLLLSVPDPLWIVWHVIGTETGLGLLTFRLLGWGSRKVFFEEHRGIWSVVVWHSHRTFSTLTVFTLGIWYPRMAEFLAWFERNGFYDRAHPDMFELSIVWPHIPSIAIVSRSSTTPQTPIGNHLHRPTHWCFGPACLDARCRLGSGKGEDRQRAGRRDARGTQQDRCCRVALPWAWSAIARNLG